MIQGRSTGVKSRIWFGNLILQLSKFRNFIVFSKSEKRPPLTNKSFPASQKWPQPGERRKYRQISLRLQCLYPKANSLDISELQNHHRQEYPYKGGVSLTFWSFFAGCVCDVKIIRLWNFFKYKNLGVWTRPTRKRRFAIKVRRKFILWTAV